MIARAEGVFDTTGVFAGMTILATVVLVAGALVDHLEHQFLKWTPGDTLAAQE